MPEREPTKQELKELKREIEKQAANIATQVIRNNPNLEVIIDNNGAQFTGKRTD